MRISNKKKLPIYNFVLTVLNVGLVIGIIVFCFGYAEHLRFPLRKLPLIIIPLLLLLIFYKLGSFIFEYDSSGEALLIRNRGVMPFQKQSNDEFPKYKLVSFEFFSFFFVKRLYVKLHSKKRKHVILKYDISFMSARQVKDLKFSLNKIIKNNKKEVIR